MSLNLDVLFAAPWHVQVHAITAIAAFFLAIVQFVAPKGTFPHKTVGLIWMLLMLAVTVSAVFIIYDRAPGQPFWAHFSWIHLFILVNTYGLTAGSIYLLRGGPQMKRHSGPFIGLFIGGLVIAGGFTFLPNRLLNGIFLGGDAATLDRLEPARLYFLPEAKTPRGPAPNEARLTLAIEELTSDAFRGRQTNTRGAVKTQKFIARRYREIGLQRLSRVGYYRRFVYGENISGRNLVGYVAGRSGEANLPITLVVAHYDGLGRAADGTVLPGANDNASGLAAMLEVAEHVAAAPLKHPVVFAALDAEEAGSAGARALVDDDRLPWERIKAVVMLDGVATADARVQVAGDAARTLGLAGVQKLPAGAPFTSAFDESVPLRVKFGADPLAPAEDTAARLDGARFIANTQTAIDLVTAIDDQLNARAADGDQPPAEERNKMPADG